MKIRAMQLKDMEEVVGMMRVFYDSPAVSMQHRTRF